MTLLGASDALVDVVLVVELRSRVCRPISYDDFFFLSLGSAATRDSIDDFGLFMNGLLGGGGGPSVMLFMLALCWCMVLNLDSILST